MVSHITTQFGSVQVASLGPSLINTLHLQDDQKKQNFPVANKTFFGCPKIIQVFQKNLGLVVFLLFFFQKATANIQNGK